MLKSGTTLLSLCPVLLAHILANLLTSPAQHALRRVISFWNFLACARRRTYRLWNSVGELVEQWLQYI